MLSMSVVLVILLLRLPCLRLCEAHWVGLRMNKAASPYQKGNGKFLLAVDGERSRGCSVGGFVPAVDVNVLHRQPSVLMVTELTYIHAIYFLRGTSSPPARNTCKFSRRLNSSEELTLGGPRRRMGLILIPGAAITFFLHCARVFFFSCALISESGIDCDQNL